MPKINQINTCHIKIPNISSNPNNESLLMISNKKFSIPIVAPATQPANIELRISHIKLEK